MKKNTVKKVTIGITAYVAVAAVMAITFKRSIEQAEQLDQAAFERTSKFTQAMVNVKRQAEELSTQLGHTN